MKGMLGGAAGEVKRERTGNMRGNEKGDGVKWRGERWRRKGVDRTEDDEPQGPKRVIWLIRRRRRYEDEHGLLYGVESLRLEG